MADVLGTAPDVLITPTGSLEQHKPSSTAQSQPQKTTAEVVKEKVPKQDPAQKTRELVNQRISQNGGGGDQHFTDKLLGFQNQFQQVPPPPKEDDNAINIWGGLSLLVAAMGGRFSRQHQTAAMNAAAAAINGLMDGKKEKYDEEFKRWQASNNNLIQSLNYQLDIYKQIMDKQYKDATIAQRHQAAEASAFFRSMGNRHAQDLADRRDMDALERFMKDVEKTVKEHYKASDDVEDYDKAIKEIYALPDDPKFKNGSYAQKQAMIQAIEDKYPPKQQAGGKANTKDRDNAMKQWNRLRSDTFPGGPGWPSDIDPKYKDSFEGFYLHAWPKYRGQIADAETEKTVANTPDYQQLSDGSWVTYNGQGDKSDQLNWSHVSTEDVPFSAFGGENWEDPEGLGIPGLE